MTIINSDWINPKTEKLINNRRYRVALFGVVDGRNVDLLPNSTTSPYLSLINGPYDKYPEGGTDGVEELSIKPILQFVDGRLHVQQQGLKRVELYGMNGMLVASSAANDTRQSYPLHSKGNLRGTHHHTRRPLHKRYPISNYPIIKSEYLSWHSLFFYLFIIYSYSAHMVLTNSTTRANTEHQWC